MIANGAELAIEAEPTMLTAKQQQLLFFLHHRLSDTGISPSFEEMKDALGLRSKSGIHRLITALEERGFIRRMPNRARALEVLRLPAGMMSSDNPANGPVEAGRPQRGFTPNVIHGNFGESIEGRPIAEAADAVQLPLYGRIAAGTPIEALRDADTFTEVPVSMLGNGEHYALEVAGDSMIEAGIFDGDTVIIERCEMADTGTIIVALVDDQEVTLKRLRKKGGTIALEPANASYETRIFGNDRVRVQGRLVGLMRQY